MKALVVYYSLTGVSRQLALTVANELGADKVAITTVKELSAKKMFPLAPMSIFGKAAINPVQVNPRDYDLIVLATPVWIGRPAAPLVTWLKSVTLTQKDVALLLTYRDQAGNAMPKLEKLVSGARVIDRLALQTKNHPQSELDEQARLWADELTEDIQRLDAATE